MEQYDVSLQELHINLPGLSQASYAATLTLAHGRVSSGGCDAFAVNIICDRVSATVSGSEELPSFSARGSILIAVFELDGSGCIFKMLLWR